MAEYGDVTASCRGKRGRGRFRTHGDSDNCITQSVGTAWADPVYDAAGNMTTAPKPGSLATGLTLTYDAWNRLVKVSEGATTVAEYQYDGRNFRTVKKSYSGGALSEVRHFYYNAGWQVLEERVGESTTAERQYVWGDRYVDDLVLRDRDTVAGDGLEERLYAMQDPNWNVAAVAESDGDVQERYTYTAYGVPTYREPDWDPYANPQSLFSNTCLYTGRQRDLETGIYYYRMRYYGADLGRFLSRDPVGYLAGDPNLYAYVFSTPMSMVDPFGLAIMPPSMAEGMKPENKPSWLPDWFPWPIIILPSCSCTMAAPAGYFSPLAPATSRVPSISLPFETGFVPMPYTPGVSNSPDAARKPWEPDKPGRKKQGREQREKKKDKNWKPRNPPREPPPHTPGRDHRCK